MKRFSIFVREFASIAAIEWLTSYHTQVADYSHRQAYGFFATNL